MNEAETRAEHIDPALKAAGWGVVEGSRVRRGKGLTADCVLEYRNTKLAVIEAKTWNAALTEGVAQAKNYADGKVSVHIMGKDYLAYFGDYTVDEARSA